ncbi:MAG TPA: hypothetical protein VNA44_08350 [Burkholderiaceae bacterium]|nr:hypothetical protein [Burkholderiaceae bacterium]
MMKVLQSALILGVVVTCGGCVSIPPEARYPEISNDVPAATIVNQGAVGGSTTTCQLPAANRVCRAALMRIDNKVAPTIMGSENRVEPGVRTIMILCTFHEGLPAFLGSSRGTISSYEVALEANRSYYVRGVMKDGACAAWLAESENGEMLGRIVPFQPALGAPTQK